MLTHLCGGVGSKGFIRVMPRVFIGPNRPKFGHVKGGFSIGWACKGKISLVLELHKLVCPRFCPVPNLSRVGLPEVRRIELADLL